MKYNDEYVYELILDNTKRLLNERGVKGWSMDELARDSSVAKNTLYKIVGSKREAVSAVVFRDIEKVRLKLEYLMAKKAGTITLDDFIEGFLMTFSHLHIHYLTDVTLEFPASGLKIEKAVEEIRKLLIQLFETIKTERKLREDLDINLLFDCIRGISTEFIRLGYTDDIFVQKSRIIYEYLLHGILCKP